MKRIQTFVAAAALAVGLCSCQTVGGWWQLHFVVPKNPFEEAPAWQAHRPGDPMPCPPRTRVQVLMESGIESSRKPAEDFSWGTLAEWPDAERVVAWRPVHTNRVRK